MKDTHSGVKNKGAQWRPVSQIMPAKHKAPATEKIQLKVSNVVVLQRGWRIYGQSGV
jgi:hypothetical protein